MSISRHAGLDALSRLPFVMVTVVAAALTACGGGSSDPSSATASATGGTKTALAASVASGGEGGATFTTIAAEGQAFTVSGTQTVQFGAGTSWVSLSVSNGGMCTNGFFGSDPAFGTVKSCQLITVGTSSSAGTGSSDGSAASAGSGSSAATGSGDSSGATASSGATVTAWVRVAMETDSYTVASPTTVRFGDGMNWTSKSVTSGGTCSVGDFGSDPAYGTVKFCEAQMTVPAVTQIDGVMPVVNKALIPGAATPYTTARVRTLSPAELASANFQPMPALVGAFREPCNFSHMTFDDPIVFPGNPGASHLHTFMGASNASAATTAANLLTDPGSTCSGGTLNKTAYWMPTMIDTRTGQPLVPKNMNFYYKLGYLGVVAGTVQPFPAGLRMIAGSAAQTTPVSSIVARFGCATNGTWQPSIPSCAIGDVLIGAVVFPQCWDGVNLDSPDHKSHMAYATGNGCPADHPVPLAEITMNVEYLVTEANTGNFWKLSSDNYSGPGGYSLHADWFGAWDLATNKAFVNNCINSNLDCHDQLLGDGRILY